MTGSHPVAELVRLPAALSVPGDVLLGAAAAGWPFGRRTARLVGASACLYWAGMAANDWADREVDAVERPGRPIPSGRVSPSAAAALAGALTLAGVAIAGMAGRRRALRVAVPLAATVWAYDLRAKSTVAGPAVMAAARGLDVLLGAGGAARALPAVATVAAHTAVVTRLSRTEAAGGDPRAARTALAGTLAVAVLAAAGPVPAGGRGTAHPAGSPLRRAARLGHGGGVARSAAVSALWGVGGLGLGGSEPGHPGRGVARSAAAVSVLPGAAGLGLAAAYATVLGRAQLAAVRDPRPATVQAAVGAGVLGIVPLEAALLARAGALLTASGVAALWPLARRLSRRVSPT